MLGDVMRGGRRILISAFLIFSTLIGAGTIALWVHSRSVSDYVARINPEGNGWRFWRLLLSDGTLVLSRDWTRYVNYPPLSWPRWQVDRTGWRDPFKGPYNGSGWSTIVFHSGLNRYDCQRIEPWDVCGTGGAEGIAAQVAKLGHNRQRLTKGWSFVVPLWTIAVLAWAGPTFAMGRWIWRWRGRVGGPGFPVQLSAAD